MLEPPPFYVGYKNSEPPDNIFLLLYIFMTLYFNICIPLHSRPYSTVIRSKIAQQKIGKAFIN